jgi:hypothetical protein
MNIEEFKKSSEYLDFIRENSGIGKLKIRAYAASEALPVSGLNIMVSSVIFGKKIIFYNGVTDSSGVIPTISLPAPKLISNLEIPNTIKYDIEVVENKNNFSINMYDGVCVVQNINYTGEVYGN